MGATVANVSTSIRDTATIDEWNEPRVPRTCPDCGAILTLPSSSDEWQLHSCPDCKGEWQ